MAVETLPESALQVLEGIEMSGTVNTPDAGLLANIEHSIRLGHPQVRLQAPQKERVCLVGGGPSLEDTLEDLRALYFAGAKIVTVNGSAQWCLEHNLRPSAHIVLDARASNARFVDPVIPQCRYLVASQCHPDTWAAVADRPDVWIWHAVADESDRRETLDAYYLTHWQPIHGGTTVIMRALMLLRVLGFLRMDLFGVDSCWLAGQHHAYDQVENAQDKRFPITVHPSAHAELGRTFWVSPWHIKQLEDFLQTVRFNGDQFLLNIHGDGLLAFALRAGADVSVVTHETAGEAVTI